MNTYEITFRDEIDAATEEQAYDKLLEFLTDCVENGDVSPFQFFEINREIKK